MRRYRRRRSATASYPRDRSRSEEHTSELQSHSDLVCRLLLEKKKKHFIVSEPRSNVTVFGGLSTSSLCAQNTIELGTSEATAGTAADANRVLDGVRSLTLVYK